MKVFILLFCLIGITYAAEDYQTRWEVINTKTQDGILVLTDLCGKEHKLHVARDEVGSGKTLKWFEYLVKSGELDKCIDSK